MKGLLKRILPQKNHFVGVDIGTHKVKVAEVKVMNGIPEVTGLKCYPSPKGVWTDQFDEERLVITLKEVNNFQLKEVVTCIGGEKLISRIIRLPRMANKEIEAAARYEVEKFVPIPVNQLIIRPIPLDKFRDQKEGENFLLLAVPSATVFQYHSIFSRAGMTVTSIDVKAFALWRLFGQTSAGILAIADIGAKTSHFVVVKDGLIKFVRLLPVGGNILTNLLMETYGVKFWEAQQIKEEAAVSLEGGQCNGTAGIIRDILHEGVQEISGELNRSLEFCCHQENLKVERLILSGGTCKLKGIAPYLQNELKIPVEEGVPGLQHSEDGKFDPQYSIAVGLALREVVA